MTKKLVMLVVLAAGAALCVGSFMAWNWFGPPPQEGSPTATYGMFAGGPVTLAAGLVALVAGLHILKRGNSLGWAVSCAIAMVLGLLVAIRFFQVDSAVPRFGDGVQSLGNGLVICLLASAVGSAASIYLVIAARVNQATPGLTVPSH